ncbi:hypothetical protein NOMA109596_08750 [Nocardioides marinus]|jgi:hypothetical protein|uniref:Uncharacterized protein n=1 Tax=Nocardioides marinus TaxID=374514 RepID=A0A7Y9YFA2_9ACTN|nr:hypothetical protein [Nocardioides marinus]NYI09994.1 hypothetical protein [Nocardioides marinus]
MSDKSPGHGKSPKSGKSIKEKRAEKRAKAVASDVVDPLGQPGRKR